MVRENSERLFKGNNDKQHNDMRKQIYIDRTEKTRMCREFNVSNVTLWSALTFQTKSGKANMLRKVAMERGGKEVGDGAKDNTGFETTFQTSAGTMTQEFSKRVKIVVYMKTGRTVVLVDDEPKATSDHLTIPEFMKLQSEVKRIALELQ